MKKSSVNARKNLINARNNMSLTQEEVAKHLQLSTRQYQSLEAGTSDGRIKIWYKLKDLLNVDTIDYLLEQEVNDICQNDTTKKDRSQD